MEIVVNDEPRQTVAACTVAALLQELGINSRFLAVERNGQIVPRRDYADCNLQEGDRLEIVTLVGGG